MQIRNIVIRMPNWIGDTVMAQEALYSIKKHYTQARVTLLCKAPQALLFESSPLFDQVLEIDLTSRFFPKFKNGQSVISWLKKKQFCLGILLTNSFSSALMFKRGGVGSVVGYKRFLGFALLHQSFFRPRNKELNMRKYYLHLIEALGIKRARCIQVVGCKKGRDRLKLLNLPKSYILLSPIAAYGSAKCWPIDRYWALAKKLNHAGIDVVITSERKMNAPLEHNRLHNISGQTTLLDLVAVLQYAAVVVANDSGPLHIASHMHRPLVAFFGSTPVEKAEPYKGASILSKDVVCSPCYKKVCPTDFRCMLQISVDEVFNAVLYQKERFKKIAVAILAGGMGQRLGASLPKAVLSFGQTTLLKHHLIQIPDDVRVFILTSPVTHQPIVDYLQENKYFGKEITLYSKKEVACTHSDGSPSEKKAPEGNGAFYDCIIASGFFKKYSEIEVVNCIPIDNPLAKPLCFDLVHACLEQKLDTAFSCIEREQRDPIGILLEKKSGLQVVEYTDGKAMSLPIQETRIGFINLFCVRKEFILQACKKEFSWHRVQRGETFHFERWIFDPFNLITNYKIFIRDKQNYFYPLKTKDDLEKVGQILYTSGKENLVV